MNLYDLDMGRANEGLYLFKVYLSLARGQMIIKPFSGLIRKKMLQLIKNESEAASEIG